ncbi:reverse transcriptase domain-containing protein [Tanacetum coccineum]
MVETLQGSWTLFTNGSSCVDGSGAGLILTSLEGTEFTYSLRFQFTASNNEAEYKALIAGLRIAAQIGVCNKKSIQEEEVATVVEEEGPIWMTPIMEYLKDGTLPGDIKEASKLYIKARQYELMEGVLYRWSFLKPWLRNPQQSLTPITAPWPFYKWGIDIAGPFPEGPGKVKFFIVAMDYFTKWIEEKAVATITGNQAHRIMIKSSHSDTPFFLTYGTEAVIPTEIGMPTYRTVAVDFVHNDEELRLNLDLLEEQCERAVIHEARAKFKMTKYYNVRVCGVTFRPGNFVYRNNIVSHAVGGGKLGLK